MALFVELEAIAMSEARYQGTHLHMHTDFADNDIIGFSTLSESRGIAIGRNVQATVVSHLNSTAVFQRAVQTNGRALVAETASDTAPTLLQQLQPAPEQRPRVAEQLQTLQEEINRQEALDIHMVRKVLFELAQLLPDASRQTLLHWLTKSDTITPAIKIMGRRILG
jgi:hypothetical protein